MKIIIFFWFIFFSFQNFSQFLAYSPEQEYTLCCEENKTNCYELHQKYLSCGKKIFGLWFLLDIMQSIFVKNFEYNYLCADVLINMMTIYEELFDIYSNLDVFHKKDLEKIEYFLSKISSHQVINSIDYLKTTFTSCHNLLEQMKEC